MDRRERRRRARERKKIEEKIKKAQTQEVGGFRQRAKRYFLKTVSGTKLVKNLFFGGLTLAGGYALFHPHVSVEPGLLLEPVNPFSTQFIVKNESKVLAVHDLTSICWTEKVDTGNNISVWAPARFERVQHTIPILEPLASSTIQCPPVIGGLGTYTGTVLRADIEMRVSYKQTGWPFTQTEDYPFTGVRDVRNSVHWVHITRREQRISVPTPSK
jgi:hypothetical protein